MSASFEHCRAVSDDGGTRPTRRTMAKRTACHKIIIGTTAIMEMTMVIVGIGEETRNAAHNTRILFSRTRSTRWRRFACGNFHFITSWSPRCGPPPPPPPSLSLALVMHHFGNNVRGFLTATLYTRVERLLLSLSLYRRNPVGYETLCISSLRSLGVRVKPHQFNRTRCSWL